MLVGRSSTGHARLRLHVQAGETVGGLHGVSLFRKPLHQVLLGNGEHTLLFTPFRITDNFYVHVTQ